MDGAEATVSDPFHPAPGVPDDDPIFRDARHKLVDPPPARTGALVYIVLFLLFVFGQLDGLSSLPGLALLVAVVIFHEAGHAAGMRLFGFRDVRMFFIPFFGAAVAGRPQGVAAWKEALVSLLGPVPGIALGFAGFMVFARYPFDAIFQATQVLLLLNVFNLLPLGPLDGGRFLQRVLFSRHRVLDVGFQAIGSGLLAIFSLKTGTWALLIFVGLGLLTLPWRWRLLGAAAELRRELPDLPSDPARIDDQRAWILYQRAWRVHGSAAGAARRIPETMSAILEATKPPPGAGASIALLVLYLAAAAVGVAGAVLVSVDAGSANWRPVSEAEFRVDLPRAPMVLHDLVETPAGPRPATFWRAAVAGTHRFTVEVVDAGAPIRDPDRWIDAARDRLAAETRTRPERESPVEVDGARGREIDLARWGRMARARILVDGDHLYVAIASAGSWSPEQDRFLHSFRIRGGDRAR